MPLSYKFSSLELVRHDKALMRSVLRDLLNWIENECPMVIDGEDLFGDVYLRKREVMAKLNQQLQELK